MDDGRADLILEHLRRIRTSIDDMRDDIRELKARMSAMVANVAVLGHRMERFDERLARIERRLDLRRA